MLASLLNSRWPGRIASLPWGIIGTVTFISFFGCVVLYSAAGGHFMPWALPQGARFLLFLVMAVLIAQIPIGWLMHAAFPFYWAVLAALLAVELIGAVAGGSQRWLDLGFIRLQPSELMKIAIIMVLARYYHYVPRGHATKAAGILPPLLLIGLPAALVLVEPDLGTAVTIIAAGAIVMLFGGLPWRWVLIPAGAGLAALPVAFSMLHSYQQRRVLTFLNPEIDPLGAGYHITQSKIAIGSGGLFGKGFLQGTQSHLDYLPEAHTDFVFATMAEEWGVIGAVALWTAYGIWLLWALRVARETENTFGRMLMGGLSITILLYVAINSMMVMGLAPVVGIPLPLFSYGGSAQLTSMLALGLMLAVYRQQAGKGPEK